MVEPLAFAPFLYKRLPIHAPIRYSFKQSKRALDTAHDTQWVLSLFGTAVGAGILFLPINLGLSGLVPLLIMAALAFLWAFLAHRGFYSLRSIFQPRNADFTEMSSLNILELPQVYGNHFTAVLFVYLPDLILIYGVGSRRCKSR